MKSCAATSARSCPCSGSSRARLPTFQATVHQALFLANGGLLAGWLNPAGNNLTERLTKIDGSGGAGRRIVSDAC